MFNKKITEKFWRYVTICRGMPSYNEYLNFHSCSFVEYNGCKPSSVQRYPLSYKNFVLLAVFNLTILYCTSILYEYCCTVPENIVNETEKYLRSTVSERYETTNEHRTPVLSYLMIILIVSKLLYKCAK